MRSSRGTNEYNDELKTGQSCSYEGIYTNDFNKIICFGSNPQGWSFVLGESKGSRG